MMIIITYPLHEFIINGASDINENKERGQFKALVENSKQPNNVKSMSLRAKQLTLKVRERKRKEKETQC